MEVSLYDSMYRAMIHKTDSTWAVIEINYSNPSTSAEMENQCSHALHKKKAKSTHKIDEKHPKPMWNYERPQLTIRMHPIAVPDTRSYRYLLKYDQLAAFHKNYYKFYGNMFRILNFNVLGGTPL